MISDSLTLKQALDKSRTFERRHLGEILFHNGIITAAQLKLAMKKQASQDNKEPIGEILKKLGAASDFQIREALSCCLEIPFVRLGNFELDTETVKLIPQEFARAHTLIPLMFHKDRLVVAMEDPTDSDSLNMLNFITGHVIEPVISSVKEIEYAISSYYVVSDEEEILNDLPSSVKNTYWEEQQTRKLAIDRPTVKLVHNLIVDAITRGASDIHIRPGAHDVDILFRVDGTLESIRKLDKKLLQGIVARIKIIAGMNIAEHRLPQDGRSKIKVRRSPVDLRVSVMPSIHGESVVVRVLDTSTSLKKIEDIGFSKDDAELFSDLVNKGSGLILVTGPTGSGKTTTLYAALQEIKKQNINIITVEDPVEYQIEDIVQIQVNQSIGYSFAKALRNILRHDPDAIMIGEIRDEETAKIAVESSLTGHLVLSTLHTNSAATTVTRLLEIGILPYLLNSTLLAVVAQRLAKRNCPHCLTEDEPIGQKQGVLNIDPNETFYKSAGCEKCHGTGFLGRIAVYELLRISPTIREMIQPAVNATDIERAAKEQGMVTIAENALNLARNRVICLDEAMKLCLS